MSERINPWFRPGDRVEANEDWAWEQLPIGNDPAVYRLRVEGGWLYRLNKSTAATFVPHA